MSQRDAKRSGMSFTEGLQLVFIGLKLTGYINWSWWWVMAPTLVTLSFAGLTLALAAILVLIEE